MAFLENIFGKKEDREKREQKETRAEKKVAKAETKKAEGSINTNENSSKEHTPMGPNVTKQKEHVEKSQMDSSSSVKKMQETKVDSAKAPVVAKTSEDEASNDNKVGVNSFEDKESSTGNHQINKIGNTHTHPIVTPKISKPIIVKFVSNGQKIANDFAFTGSVGTELTIDKLPNINGYKLPSGEKIDKKVSEKEQILTLTYLPDNVSFTIVPVTEDQQPINNVPVKSYKGRVGNEILSTLMPKLKGYILISNRSYTVPKKGGQVLVTYKPRKRDILVVYQTTTGENLDESYIHGKVGEMYEINAGRHQFKGYRLVRDQKQLKGIYDSSTTKITVKYEPIPTTLEVSFIDESGNQVHKPLTYNDGHYKEPYSIKLPVIDGYELTSSPELLSGVYTQAEEVVVLRFKRATVAFKVNFWFDAAHRQNAHKPIIVSGIVNDLYEVSVPVINGYHPDKEIIKGRFQAIDNPDIDVVYSKLNCQVKILLEDEDGRLLSIKQGKNILKESGKWGDTYKISLPDVPGYEKPKNMVSGKYHLPIQTIEINYKPKQVTLTVNYLDNKTKKPIDHYEREVYNYLSGATYSADPLNIEGFLLHEVPKNANGVIGSEPIVVNFMYDPKPSTIIFHYNDTTSSLLDKDDKITGYFGEEYNYEPKQFPGFKFVNSTGKLKGKFPAGRLDIYLTYRPSQVAFSLIPTDQFGHQIDEYYNQHINGLVNQKFSIQMPSIPGFTLDKHVIKGIIRTQYNGQDFPINYHPKRSQIVVHTLIKGGNRDGQHPFKDDVLSGKVNQGYEVSVKEIPGYHSEQKRLSGIFEAETKDLTIIYLVNTEDYEIEFVEDKNHKVVGAMPKSTGYYDEAIEVEPSIPNGYFLPAGMTESKVHLNGSHKYQVVVVPKQITIDLVAQTESGDPLNRSKEVMGSFKEPKTVTVPIVDGYEPVNGDKLTLDFNLENGTHQTIPVVYKPQERKVTVRYISLQGDPVHAPEEYKGYYNEKYTIKARKIPGYFVVDSTIKEGTYGLKDTDAAFVYRAGSDEFSAATADLDDILTDQKSQSTSAPSDIVRNTVEQTPDAMEDSNEEFVGQDIQTEFETPYASISPTVNSEQSSSNDLKSILSQDGHQETRKPQNLLNKVYDDEKQNK